MHLRKIGHVLIAVSDLARARDFYTRILGFKILENDPDHGGLFLTIGEGSHVIDLAQLPDKSPPPAPKSFADLESVYTEVANELRHQYALYYAPSNRKRDGQFRRVRVETIKPDSKVSARIGYYAPGRQ